MKNGALLRVRDLIRARRFTPAERAAYSASHPWEPRARPPTTKPGLALFGDAAALWAAVVSGDFLQPVRDAGGRLAWPRAEVDRWRRHQK